MRDCRTRRNRRGGGAAGDLYLRVRLAKHPDFEVEDHNLIYELELAPWEAALGAEISVPTLDGHVNIKIPAGTPSGQKLRVRGRGLPARRRPAICSWSPKSWSAQNLRAQKKLWEQLAPRIQIQSARMMVAALGKARIFERQVIRL